MTTTATLHSLAEAGRLLAQEDPGLLFCGNGEQTKNDLAETLDTAAALRTPMTNDEAWRVSAAEHMAGRPQWRPLAADAFEYLLGVLPPHMTARFNRTLVAFLVGEPHHFDRQGNQVYLAVRSIYGPRFEAKMATESEFRAEFPAST
jgi:hypothetical protein